MILIVLLIVFLLSIKRNGNWAAPTVLMSGLWFAILLLYKSNIVELNSVSSNTYMVICVGILSFSFGSLIGGRKKIVFALKDACVYSNYNYSFRYRTILCLAIISFILQLPDVLHAVTVLTSGGDFGDLRDEVSNTVINNVLVNAFQNYIVRPFIIFLYPTAAYCILTIRNDSSFTNRQIKKWIFIFSAILSVTQMFTSGGRASVVYFLVHIIIIMRLMKMKIQVSKKVKCGIFLIVVAVVVGVYYVSVSRGIDDVWESFVYYFDGCVPLLDYHLNKTIENQTYTHGLSFLFAPVQLFFTLLSNIGIPYPEFVERVTDMINVEASVQVGPTIHMNAFVSWFFYFYKDFGYFSLIIESVIYGAVCRAFYKDAVADKDNVRSIIGYAILTNTIIFSMVRYQLINYHYLIAFILIPFLIRRKRN